MVLDAQTLRDRTKQFAIRLVHLFRALPRSGDAQIVGKQVLRAGTSAAANYRTACRARSKPEFIAKLCIVVEEMDETSFWLELMSDSGIMKPQRLTSLLQEAGELTRIFSSARRTAMGDSSRVTAGGGNITKSASHQVTQ